MQPCATPPLPQSRSRTKAASLAHNRRRHVRQLFAPPDGSTARLDQRPDACLNDQMTSVLLRCRVDTSSPPSFLLPRIAQPSTRRRFIAPCRTKICCSPLSTTVHVRPPGDIRVSAGINNAAPLLTARRHPARPTRNYVDGGRECRSRSRTHVLGLFRQPGRCTAG